MKGKNYLLITSILIIAGAITGFILNINSNLLPAYWQVPRLVTSVICLFFLLTGILGFMFRNRFAMICVIFGTAFCALSILSIPVMFWIGGGSAPFGLVLTSFVYFMIFGLYLTGVFLNKKTPKKEVYFIPCDFVPVHYHS